MSDAENEHLSPKAVVVNWPGLIIVASLCGLSILATLFLLALQAARMEQKVEQTEADRPPDFDSKKLEHSVKEYLGKNHEQLKQVEVRLLAWHSIEDDRPLRVVEALVWARFVQADDKSRWSLMRFFAHPPQDRWSLSSVADAPGIAFHPTFDHAPTNNDIYEFLDQPDFEWEFSPESGWRILDADVREQTWVELVGERPSRFYPKEVERSQQPQD